MKANSLITLQFFQKLPPVEQHELVLQHGTLETELEDPVFDFQLYTLDGFFVEIIKEVNTGNIIGVKSYVA